MAVIDIIILGVLGIFVFLGLLFGFVRTLGSLLGTVIAVFLTAYFYDVANTWLGGFLGTSFFLQATFYLTVFLILSRLIGFVVWLLEKTFGLLKIVPFVGLIDKMLGAGLGLIEGVIFIAFAATILTTAAQGLVPEEVIKQTVNESTFINLFLLLGSMLAFLLPDSFHEFI